MFLETLNADFAALTPEQWAEEESERALWDTTNMDGLLDE